MELLPSDLVPRLVGAFGGTVIAVALSDDVHSWRGLLRRFVVAMICGMLLADPLGDYLGIGHRIVAASCLAASLGWWVMHGIIRAIQAGVWFRRAG